MENSMEKFLKRIQESIPLAHTLVFNKKLYLKVLSEYIEMSNVNKNDFEVEDEAGIIEISKYFNFIRKQVDKLFEKLKTYTPSIK
jgi:hypothetical protein